MGLTRHRALVLTIPTAASPMTNGATLRLRDVLAALEASGHDADVVQEVPASGQWCTAVAVSYASAGQVRLLRRRAPRVWLDAMDSWLLLNGSGMRRGRPSYAARAVRDGARLLRMPTVGLATYISAADRRADRRTVRAARRLVLPGSAEPPPLGPSAGRRLVTVGDWAYPPNLDGLHWLAEAVLPRDVVVDVYGPHAPALPGLRLHGYVDDPREVHRTGDVHVAAVRFGGGVKRKVLQPLLAGLPVVTTRAGSHGLRAHPLLSVHDDPAGFADALVHRLGASVAPRPALPGDLWDADDRPEVLVWLRACQASTSA